MHASPAAAIAAAAAALLPTRARGVQLAGSCACLLLLLLCNGSPL